MVKDMEKELIIMIIILKDLKLNFLMIKNGMKKGMIKIEK